jgi:hypothetical protein
MEQLTLSMGPAMAEICSFVQKATIPSKRVTLLYSIFKNATTFDNILYLLLYCALKKLFTPLQVKNKPLEGDS